MFCISRFKISSMYGSGGIRTHVIETTLMPGISGCLNALNYTGCLKKNGVHILSLIISEIPKLIVQICARFKPIFFSFEQAVIRNFTASNVYAMTNFVKAIYFLFVVHVKLEN